MSVKQYETFIDEGNPDNLRAIMEAVKENGPEYSGPFDIVCVAASAGADAAIVASI